MTSKISQYLEESSLTLSGQLLQQDDPGYDAARKVHNGLIDKRPAAIARCCGVADIADAVKMARDLDLEIAVRGGGHNVAGRATVDGGLMIDLSTMKGIHIDPAGRKARAQGGTTWAGFNRETQLHGLATTGGVVSTTGIAGLTLGGGIGWLMSQHGLALDNLLSVELVTAQGEVLRASAEENPDLFWGLRGGGGNFGIAASLEYRLHAVGPMVTGGIAAHTFDQALDLLRFYRDATQDLPDEMVAFAGLLFAPDGSGNRLAALVPGHCGAAEAGSRAMQPIKGFGSPVLDVIGPIPYSNLNQMLDAAFPKGALNYWKSNFLTELSDGLFETMIDCFERCPAPMGSLLLEHFHGAATRVGATDTAFPHRRPGYNVVIISQWTDPAANEACIAWGKETYAALSPYFAPGRYVNYLGDDEGFDAVAAAYGPNYARLKELKAIYDPDNVFHMNQNVTPNG